MSTAIIAALPRELKGLVSGWEQVETLRPEVSVYRRGRAMAACAGIGVDCAALAVDAVLRHAREQGRTPEELISFGLAGACDPTLRAGDLRWCGTVVDARSGERFAAVGGDAVLVTASTIASVAEKRRLRASYGAALVDMEAAAVARLARAHGLRFRALKAVSDTAYEAVETLTKFVTQTGHFREGAFALHTALRPAQWSSAIRLGRGSAAALRAATLELARELGPGISERV